MLNTDREFFSFFSFSVKSQLDYFFQESSVCFMSGRTCCW